MYDGWEKLDPLGSGGQGDVFLVRNPERVAELRDTLRAMGRFGDRGDSGTGRFGDRRGDSGTGEIRGQTE
jgi:hypothetical protein